jgi:PAS domain S-box-containing protein
MLGKEEAIELFRNSVDGMLLTRPDGTILAANPAACALFGYTEGELVALGAAGVVDPGDARMAPLQALRMATGFAAGELSLRRKDGTSFEAHLSSRIFTDPGGRQCTSMIVRDITDQKRNEQTLRDSESRFRSFTQSSSDWYWETDAQHRFTFFSGGAEGFSGIPAERYIGSRRGEVPGREWPPAQLAAYNAIIESYRPFDDFEYGRTDGRGEKRWASLRGRPVFDEGGRFGGYRGTGLDVTGRKRAEENMRRFRAALDVSPDLVVLIDPVAMRYVDANEAAIRVLGYSREELLSMGPQDIFSVSRDALAEAYRRLISGDLGGTTTTGVYRCKDGSMLPMEANRRAVPSGDGYIIVSVARDIRQRLLDEEALRASETRYRSMVAALAEGIIVRDVSGAIVDCNASAERILGKPLEQMRGGNYADPDWEICKEDGSPLPDDERPSWKAIRTGQGQSNVVLSHRKPDGTVLWLSLNAQPLFDASGDSVIGAVTTLTDVSERKRAEEEIRRINADLEARVAARTTELEVANRDLQSFSYSVSHDLRAPIRAIGSHAKLLMLGEPEPQSEERLRRFHAIERNAGLMSNLVDALLNLSRVNRKTIQRAQVDMAALARSVVADLQPEYPAAAVTVQDLPQGEGDPALVRQVFANLVSNSLKFSSRVEKPEITVGWDAACGCWFVRDNGAGFDMQFARKLFGAFERAHGADEFEGTGIGLAIVHRILERHGGTISAEGAEGKGATFYFTLGNPASATS